jgi:hypothetical protein
MLVASVLEARGRVLMSGECWVSSAVAQREWLVVCGLFWLQVYLWLGVVVVVGGGRRIACC